MVKVMPSQLDIQGIRHASAAGPGGERLENAVFRIDKKPNVRVGTHRISALRGSFGGGGDYHPSAGARICANA
jgi:hypothetical protein